jgi:hypothetical protein
MSLLAANNIFKNIGALYLMNEEKYNALLRRLQDLDTNLLNDKDLDILELFAQTRYLTVADIEYTIKLTKLKTAYKNLRRTIRKLESLDLIEETPGTKVELKRHNEKFFKLRDEGIYVLFLKRVHGVLSNQILLKRGEPPVSYVYNFLNNYNDNFLFELFLYPYFEKRTILIHNNFKLNLIVRLFNYLNECCKRLDLAFRAQFTIMVTKFSWKNIPGQDESGLLTSLKEIFDIPNTEMTDIHIDKPSQENFIKVTAPSWSVLIESNLEEAKAMATLVRINSNPRNYEYKIARAGSEIFVGGLQPPEDPIKRTLDYSSSIMRSQIHELVSDIGSESSQDKMSNAVLARDDKFMALLEDVRNKDQFNYEKGYNQLMELRKQT